MLILPPLVLIIKYLHNGLLRMDYLDTAKTTRHNIVLFVGYIGIAVAVAITAIILLYQAYGFGVTKKGNVTQNGLLFFSSLPNPANIAIDGKLSRYSTNARVSMLSGVYKFEIIREGYHNWERKIEVDGGEVKHFDYPLLIPSSITDKKIKTFEEAPSFSSQSDNRRWLVILQPKSMTNFLIFDLKNPLKEPVKIELPATVVSKATVNENYELISWASDNDHFLLRHDFDSKTEYIITSRTAPQNTKNLNTLFSVTPTELTLTDKKFDKYHILVNGALQSASLSSIAPVTVRENVLNYKTYGDDMVLYATPSDTMQGEVIVRLATDDATSHDIRTLPTSSNYLLDLTKYDDKLYVAVAATSQSKTYIYKDPLGQISKRPNILPIPAQVLRVQSPSYLSFSSSAQFIMSQNGRQFGVYDIENEHGYGYVTNEPIDIPAANATWVDGSHLTYVSGGRTFLFDYDYNNRQFLLEASSKHLPAFSPDSKFIYTFRQGAGQQMDVYQVSLRTKADQ